MRRSATSLFAIALGTRAGIVGLLVWRSHGALNRLLSHADAPAFISVARMLLSGVRPADGWDERAFFGWPMTFALPGSLLGYDVSCLLIGCVLASLVPVVFWLLSRDWSSSLALTVLTPTWLMHSCLGMSEPAFLLYQVAALWMWTRNQPIAASGLAAAAMLVRPNGVFVLAALALAALQRRAFRSFFAHGAFAAAATALVVVLNLHFYGDPLRQSHLYEGLPNVGNAEAALVAAGFKPGHFGPPFLHLLATPWLLPVPGWKVIFIWSHLLAVLGACAAGVLGLRGAGVGLRDLITRKAVDRAQELQLMLVSWAVLNTAFIVCTGPYWGFYSFDRYCTWALPAYVYCLRQFLPARRLTWLLVGAVSIALVIAHQARGL